MEFHLPFFALRKAPRSDSSSQRTHGKYLRDSEELVLLSRDSSGSKVQENYFLHKAHIACVTHGFDEWHWTNLTFEDTTHESEEGSDEDNDGEVGGDDAALS